MPPIRTPRSVKAATELLERYAAIEGDIALIENVRNAAIAEANKSADAGAEPLIAERDLIREKLAPWWKDAAASLTAGNRKSIELGGCMIGTRAGRDSLAINGDEDAIAEKLSKRDWAKPLVRVVTRLDKKAIMKSIDGVYRKQLAALGLSRKAGGEQFFVERAEQGGTVAGARA
ncbi:host-nuclease inhibitor Gam family protein [Novosphingobium album (ex Liu et al. 2023)]|uniref:Host-nuclease inhibitor Gam family protein n=1 Tax=Novosphingobium album (ex Liu et al. 2023) TaxID=3031130 RepID=A0ABT5WY39_9SPHN|nr:host-nuclease inhibitor Gam family protein [Novosphingobium album (ex Liu et al. 2023)]MDE8654786.1 host-nuclease inhibitor Gam family protein [Novosphingobium album (ex Liu et al. 2023)]